MFRRVTIFSIIGVRIRQELGLSETQFGLLVGAPILTGSLIRVILVPWRRSAVGLPRAAANSRHNGRKR
jgi:nitrate/nitrite transporter NarK